VMAHTLYVFQCRSTLILPVSDVTVGVQQVSYSVREADGLVMVCTILTGETQREVLVNLTTLSGSAQGQLSPRPMHAYPKSHGNKC